MATTSVSKHIAIPGLDIAPTLDNLEKSRLAYNALPDDRDQPHVADVVLADLKGLLEEYNVQEKFGYHLVHGHLQVAPGRVMLGQPMTKLDACWTRPTSFKKVALGDVHGHIFVLDAKGQFTPYAYRQGPPPQITANETAFISAAQSYLAQNHLATLIGIQLLSGDGAPKDMQEFVLSDNHGTVMMDANMTNADKAYRVTGWTLVRNVDGTTELKGIEQYTETVRGPYKVFIDGSYHRYAT
ncbi:hypothetical protein NKR23_g2130 [Pleurostoma richardsiae]|uniref:Uncharacterized protein n=1 Tax=Pleurostoma richardsiae TaxID=41990 RepID=A0AA38SBX1_9PEZI|nr:hypothetical protein NKR23_g2130 [Pleurostoma richardsiae]